MSMTPYTGETLTIANIGTTPQERAMETSEFKMAFSKDFHEFVEWFNETHNGEIDAHMADYASHKAESATEEKLGHVKVDGETILINEDGVISGAALTNKNLLHNWDFRNPVNQRGQSSYSVVYYTIDRWRTNDANISVNINSGYITLSNNGAAERHFLQQFEFMVPGDYTVSLLLANGDILSESLNVNDSVAGGSGSSSVKSLTAGLRVQIGDFSSKPAFKLLIAPGYSFNIVAVKLELGSVSTLANDPPADYGEQLALCQRYYQKINILRPLCSCHSTRLEFMVPLSVPLRSVPTIESYSVPAWFRVDGNQYVGSDYIAASNAASVLDSNYSIFTSAITIMFSLSPEISAINQKLGYTSNFTAALSADL